jgi:integrase
MNEEMVVTTDTAANGGGIKAKGPRGFGRKYLRGDVVWIEFWHRGKQCRESTGQTGRAGERAADKLLKKRWQAIGQGRFVGPSEERVLLTALLDAVKVDYEVNGRRSGWTLAYRLKPLRVTFAGERAVDVTEERIARYTQARLTEGYAPASVNRELAVLRRAFRLAVRQKRISVAPVITMLVENNARQGFVEPATFLEITKHLTSPLDDVARFGYLTGARKNEVLTLAWANVDRARGVVTISREHSKNAEPRIIALTAVLAAIIERRWKARTISRPDGTILADLVFHRKGCPVGSFRKAWASACKAAGVPGLLFHDLRRSAVRNFERAGVSQAVAMKITGHKTASVYRRYRIVDERDVREALAKTEVAIAAEQTATVVSLTSRTRQAQA